MTNSTVLDAPVATAGFRHAVLSEWTKIRSVRSTYWTIAISVLGTTALTALIAWAMMISWDQTPGMTRVQFEPASFALSWTTVAMTAMAVMGVLAITSEFGTGQVRSTLSATPNRILVLGAKAMNVGLLGLVTGALAAFPAFLVAQAIFAMEDVGIALGEPGALEAVLRAALVVALLALLGMAFGALLRSTAGAITLTLALLWLPAFFLPFVPEWVTEHIIAYTPAIAATVMLTLSSESTGDWAFTPGGGTVVMTAWVVVVSVAAALVMRRRDA